MIVSTACLPTLASSRVFDRSTRFSNERAAALATAATRTSRGASAVSPASRSTRSRQSTRKSQSWR